MPRPLTMDLRERIAEAVNAGLSCSAAARRFAVAASSAIKLMQAPAQTGSLAPNQRGGYRTAILAPHEATVRALGQETPDATLEELRLAVRKQKIKVGRSALAACLVTLRLPLKKNRCTPARKIGLMGLRRGKLTSPNSRTWIWASWGSSLKRG